MSRLIDLLFDAEGYRCIWADTDPDNAASNGLLTRLGFSERGICAPSGTPTSASATPVSGGC